MTLKKHWFPLILLSLFRYSRTLPLNSSVLLIPRQDGRNVSENIKEITISCQLYNYIVTYYTEKLHQQKFGKVLAPS